MDLSELKRSPRLLLAVLGRDRAGQHLRCAFHQEEHGSMAVWESDDGVWMWKCHSGCGGGTIIDAAMLKWGVTDARGAIHALEKELGVKLNRDVEVVESRIDTTRAERFIAAAHETLMSDFELQEELLLGKRGIRNLDEARRYRLGYVREARFAEWFKWRITGWVLPVTDHGRLVGVKLHQEGRRNVEMRESPKCLWAPFGLTAGTGKPKHAALTLWPEPERWQQPDRLWLCPGELKALALISSGFPAVSSTAGEGSRFAPFMMDRIKACGPKRVVLNYDDDDAGRKWLEQVAPLTLKAGIETLKVSGKELCRMARELASAPAPEPQPEATDDDQDMMDADFAIAMDDAATAAGETDA